MILILLANRHAFSHLLCTQDCTHSSAGLQLFSNGCNRESAHVRASVYGQQATSYSRSRRNSVRAL